MDNTKEMLGTFSPQQETYTHEMPEETTPSGIFARGTYSAKTKVSSTNSLGFLSLQFFFITPNNSPELKKEKLGIGF